MEKPKTSQDGEISTSALNQDSPALTDEPVTSELLDGGALVSNTSEPKSPTEAEEPTIEAGLVSEANKPLPFHKEKHQAETSQKLAFSLVVVLAVTIGIHYLTTIILELNGHHNAVESIEKIFNSWLPVIAGFVGAAVTYYFTKDK